MPEHELRPNYQRNREMENELKALKATEAKRIANAKLGLDERGLPIRPEFQSILDQPSGRLQQQFQIGEFDPVNLDPRALDRMRELAFAEGPSSAAQAQLDFQQTQQAGRVGELGKQQAGQQARAFDVLARQGGLGGGSRERLAREGQRAGLFGQQRLAQQGAQARQGIISEDEARKIGLLGDVRAGDVQTGQFGQAERKFEAGRREFDIQNALQELQSKREADLRAFESKSKAAAAVKSSEAQAKASCFEGNTMIQMADGLFKKIKDIELDESVMMGGTVYHIAKYRISPLDNIYNYEGITVSGSHAVLENNEWIRVKDSKKSILSDKEIDTVYNLSNENHLISAYGIVFADFEETDDFSVSDKDSLKNMNNRLKIKGATENVAIL